MWRFYAFFFFFWIHCLNWSLHLANVFVTFVNIFDAMINTLIIQHSIKNNSNYDALIKLLNFNFIETIQIKTTHFIDEISSIETNYYFGRKLSRIVLNMLRFFHSHIFNEW